MSSYTARRALRRRQLAAAAGAAVEPDVAPAPLIEEEETEEMGLAPIPAPSRRHVLETAGGAAVAAALPSSLPSSHSPSHGVPPATRDAGALAMELIKGIEGVDGQPVLFAYDDAYYPPRPVQPGDRVRGTLTIGWGRTLGVEPGDTCTPAQADAWLLDDLEHHLAAVEKLEEECVKRGHRPFLPEIAAALCSFSYNVGTGDSAKARRAGKGLLNSKSVAGRMRAGDYQGACAGLALYVYSGGQRSRGLVRRRERERSLFLAGLDRLDEEILASERARPDPPEPPLANSTTIPVTGVAGGGLSFAYLDHMTGYVQSVTGLPPAWQGYMMLAAIAALLWANRERIRKHLVGEGW